VVKHGGNPVEAYIGNERITIAVPPIGNVTDTTAAGDAFAAGYLTAGDVAPEAATIAGCQAAARLLTSR
jgi:sugar/nucleoside kinase (ribokinase family)